MNASDHCTVVAHFLPDRVEIYAVDGTPPRDPENGDAECCRLRRELEVARLLHRADPSIRVYSVLT